MSGLPRRSDIESLIVQHFDGALTIEQEKSLADLLNESQEAKEMFLSYMRLEGRLHSLGRDGLLIKVAETGRTGPTRHRTYRNAFAISALSACLVGAFFFLSGAFGSSSVNASSVMQRAKLSANQIVDRTYEVTLIDKHVSPESVSELTVDARGGGHLLVRASDGSFTLGSNGDGYWATRGDGMIVISENRGAFGPLLRHAKPTGLFFLGVAASANEPLLLDIAGLLALVERNYQIKLMDSDDPSVHWIQGKRRAAARNRAMPQSIGANRPYQIDIFVDAVSGVAIQFDVAWRGGSKIHFEFHGSNYLPKQWYDHTYHFPNRNIKSLSEEQSSNRRSTRLWSKD